MERAEVGVAVAASSSATGAEKSEGSIPETPTVSIPETPTVSNPETPTVSNPETPTVSNPETPTVLVSETRIVSVSETPPAEPELFTPGEDFDEPSVSSNAPELAVNIEQEVSLSAPPDLNSPECPSCWKALRATDKFCCWCGEAQPNRVLPFLKLCLECSTFLPEKANYCYSCGTDVGYSSRRKVRVPHELFKDEESEFFPRFDA
ncbi:MAG: zinc ribbon domain-containing protein [Cyanobacteria bacterium SZAS-4]|nr:zinc ribbon domain-containing protein [Cyanobacteria bacterium SZAS-4]